MIALLLATPPLPFSWRAGATLLFLAVMTAALIWAGQAHVALEALEPRGRRLRTQVVLWLLFGSSALGASLAVASLWEVAALASPLSSSVPTLLAAARRRGRGADGPHPRPAPPPR